MLAFSFCLFLSGLCIISLFILFYFCLFVYLFLKIHLHLLILLLGQYQHNFFQQSKVFESDLCEYPINYFEMSKLELLSRTIQFYFKLQESLLIFLAKSQNSLVVKYPISVRFLSLSQFASFSCFFFTAFSFSKGILMIITICFQLTSSNSIKNTELSALFIMPQIYEIQAYSQVNKENQQLQK